VAQQGSVDEALAAGRVFIDLSDWIKLSVTGSDCVTWLDHITTGDVTGLAPNRACVASLSDDEDEITFNVAVVGGSLLITHPPELSGIAERLRARLVPNVDVEIEDRSQQTCLFAFPQRDEIPVAPGSAHTKPSCLGPGLDLYALMSDRKRMARLLSASFLPLTKDEFDHHLAQKR
jgi:folate-binding Fe-S cluster repair protein YgfZ